MTQSLIVPVILSGGSGTRLWPVSRESFPKQLWPLASERTMIQQTALRALGPGFAPPIVVCNDEHRFLIAEQLRDAGVKNARIVVEPAGRNSAPAIAAAALLVGDNDRDVVLWILPADSAIANETALRSAVQAAAAAARAGYIVTFGMKPTAAETGYGYIEVGGPLLDLEGVYAVVRFLEKPDQATAEQFVSGGHHLWNSGMFVFTARAVEEELERHAPDILVAVRRAVADRTAELDFIRLEVDAFTACRSISIDYAVAERTERTVVVPADLGWSDVGSWSSLWELSAKDASGNVAVGDVVLEGAENCYIRSDGMLAAVVGLKDAVVVVTKDAVLAMHRAHAQHVKKIVERLRLAGRPEAVTHSRSYRPWGYYESLAKGDRFQVKRIVVSPGRQLSLQSHFHRAEHWVVVNGTARVTRDGERLIVRENESVYLPLGSVHRLENPGRIPLTLIEVQSGAYLEEDDIVRLHDDFGRS
jgi:mannose-1-phosphate guanylyltransferase / mannose-6-phosphate isomerase